MEFKEGDKWVIASALEREFQSDGYFISHLAGTTPYYLYNQIQINRLTNPKSSPEALNDISQFSDLIHQIPERNMFHIENKLLWEEYSLLLNKVVLAKNNQQDNTITNQIPDSLKEKYEKYKSIREEVFSAYSDYCLPSNDNNMRNTIMQKIDLLNKTWILDGFKQEIDNFLEKKIVSSSLCFSSLWALWKGKFNNIFTTSINLSGSEFANFNTPFEWLLNNSKWQKIEYNHQSIKAIQSYMPFERNKEDLKNYLKELEMFEFEYIKLPIERNWFVPQLFEATFWKMNTNFETELVSDGKNLPKGTIPSYIHDIIFIRSVEKKERKSLLTEGLEWIGSPIFDILNKKQPAQDTTIFLAGLICKITPLSPKPNPALVWV